MKTKIISLLLLFSGALTTYLGILEAKRGIEITKWPCTSGIILNSSLVEKIGSGKGISKIYEPSIIATYTVNSISYKTNLINYYSAKSNNEKGITEILKKYPVNKTVNVYYDRNQPQMAVLENDYSYWSLSLLVIGLSQILIFILLHFKKKFVK